MKSKACLDDSPSGECVSISHISRVFKQHPNDGKHLGHYQGGFLLFFNPLMVEINLGTRTCWETNFKVKRTLQKKKKPNYSSNQIHLK